MSETRRVFQRCSSYFFSVVHYWKLFKTFNRTGLEDLRPGGADGMERGKHMSSKAQAQFGNVTDKTHNETAGPAVK